MAGTSDVLLKIKHKPSIRYPVLVPNTKGLDNAASLLTQNPGAYSTQLEPALKSEAISKPAIEVAVFAYCIARGDFCASRTTQSLNIIDFGMAMNIDSPDSETERMLTWLPRGLTVSRLITFPRLLPTISHLSTNRLYVETYCQRIY